MFYYVVYMCSPFSILCHTSKWQCCTYCTCHK